jgi:polyisoprenoid-binding protein YceI
MTDHAALTGTYDIDPTHSSLEFVVRHALVTKVRGSFAAFSGAITVDGANPAASSAEVTIETASVTTKNADRDAHVKSADFFDVENFPSITFKSTSVTVDGDDVTLVGDLTIRETTKSVTIKAELGGTAVDPWGATRIGFEGSTEVNRSEFGLNWNAALEAGGVLVSEKVKLELDIAAVKRA